jgi:DNA-binding IclR family transcriptional regulator
MTTQAATVLAAIKDGLQVLDEIRAKSGLSVSEVIATLSWLEKAGLVTLSEEEKTLRAQLTPEAVAALR